MRRSSLAVSVLLLVACTEGTGGGTSFGSGSGAPTDADTMGPGAGGSPGQSGTGGSSGETSTAGIGSTTDTDATASESSPTASAEGSTGSSESTTGGATAADPTTESGGDPTIAGTPLDPNLDVPDEGEPCSTPGSLNECAATATVCRFYTAEEGRCESCDNCGNLNAPCTNGTDCDILFSCFSGRCTNFCELGTFGCGPVEDCLDVGHATHGVCDPFA